MKIWVATIAIGFAVVGAGCSDPGPAEQAGRQIDDTVEEARTETEQAFERLGREMDEALEETEEAVKELQEAAARE